MGKAHTKRLLADFFVGFCSWTERRRYGSIGFYEQNAAEFAAAGVRKHEFCEWRGRTGGAAARSFAAEMNKGIIHCEKKNMLSDRDRLTSDN